MGGFHVSPSLKISHLQGQHCATGLFSVFPSLHNWQMNAAQCRTSASLCRVTSDGDRWLRLWVCAREREVWESERVGETGEAEIGLDAMVRIRRPQRLCQRPSETFWPRYKLWYRSVGQLQAGKFSNFRSTGWFRVKYGLKVKSSQTSCLLLLLLLFIICSALCCWVTKCWSLNPPPGISCPLKTNYSITLCSPKPGDDQKV